MSLADRIAATLGIEGPAAKVLHTLYERQPATLDQVALRSGLDPSVAATAVDHLATMGAVRGSNYLWLDLAPLLQAVPAPGAASRPSSGETIPSTQLTSLPPRVIMPAPGATVSGAVVRTAKAPSKAPGRATQAGLRAKPDARARQDIAGLFPEDAHEVHA